jgi:hypothetical protein
MIATHAALGKPRKQALQCRCLIHQHGLGVFQIAPIYRRRLFA